LWYQPDEIRQLCNPDKARSLGDVAEQPMAGWVVERPSLPLHAVFNSR